MEMLKAEPLTCPLACANPVIDRIGIRAFSLRLRSVARKFDIDELKIIQPAIGAEFLHQFFMAADVGYRPTFYYRAAVGATHCRKAVSDDDNGASRHKVLQSGLDEGVGFAIQCRSGFVEDK